MEEQLFKKFIGTKTVKAMPMSAHDAKKNGAQLTEMTLQRNLGAEGYLVEYPDGYRSWSPKKAFDEAYKPADTYIDRMKIEHEELSEKICKAMKAYLSVDDNLSMDRYDKVNLRKQIDAMMTYADVLGRRIEGAIYSKTPTNNIGCVPPITCDGETKQKGN